MDRANLNFEPIERETVSAQIKAQLMRRITTGELAPGQRVPSERALSDQFRVARTSVREAMQGLVSVGAIERRGNRSFVAEHMPEIKVGSNGASRGFIGELFETRRVLEVPVFVLAAERATKHQRDTVAELNRRFDPAMNIDDFRPLDREFHTGIASACGNPLLIELYGKVLDRLFRSQTFDSVLSNELNRSEVRGIVTDAVAAHTQIASAFAAADIERMREAAATHLSGVEHRMSADLI